MYRRALKLGERSPKVIERCLETLGIKHMNPGVYNGDKSAMGREGVKESVCPTTGQTLASVHVGGRCDMYETLAKMKDVKKDIMMMPAPKRGQIIKTIRKELETNKVNLAMLISLEMGKIYTEALGEVQECIDVCDLAIGLSRQVGGSVFPSERAGHFYFEQYTPLGTVGIISAANFPMAVYMWNLALGLVCGNTVVWKGAETTNLCSIAMIKLVQRALEAHHVSPTTCSLVTGGGEVGWGLANHPRVDLVSFTGSTAVGKEVGVAVQSRFGRSILELGGNNATIIMDDADIDLACKSVLFAAVGTTGQRCTTTRRLYVHDAVYDQVRTKLIEGYKGIVVGDPLSKGVLCGPLHTKKGVETYEKVVRDIGRHDAEILFGGHVHASNGNFVEPTLVEVTSSVAGEALTRSENFVPILFMQKVFSLEDAIQANNSVTQGLSSAMFTNNVTNVFTWANPSGLGSDCAIVNVNASTSGAEIGGAFGCLKEGQGTESGSDSWKQYMKRQTVAVNWSGKMSLAQGVKFE